MVKLFLSIPFMAVLAVLTQGCVSKGSPVSQLGTPMFVPASVPDSVTESGIGQDPATGGISLQWYTTEGAYGYKLFRSDSVDGNGNPVDFSQIANIFSSGSLNDTSTIDVNSIKTGLRYFYFLRAYQADGALSAPSDTINYELLVRPVLESPPDFSVVDVHSFYLEWYDISGGGYAVMRVKDITSLPPQIVWVSKRFQDYNSYAFKSYNFDGAATDSLISGHSYQWRVDRFNPGANQGARSAWRTFTVK
jgi:hypothetical protein